MRAEHYEELVRLRAAHAQAQHDLADCQSRLSDALAVKTQLVERCETLVDEHADVQAALEREKLLSKELSARVQLLEVKRERGRTGVPVARAAAAAGASERARRSRRKSSASATSRSDDDETSEGELELERVRDALACACACNAHSACGGGGQARLAALQRRCTQLTEHASRISQQLVRARARAGAVSRTPSCRRVLRTARFRNSSARRASSATRPCASYMRRQTRCGGSRATAVGRRRCGPPACGGRRAACRRVGACAERARGLYTTPRAHAHTPPSPLTCRSASSRGTCACRVASRPARPRRCADTSSGRARPAT
jgi:hypothetical protein